MEWPYKRSEPQPDRSLKHNLTNWAKKHPEFTVPPAEVNDQKTRNAFDVFDATKIFQCQVQLTRLKKREPIPGEEHTYGQRLLSCLLVGQKDDEQVEIDLYKMIEDTIPGVRIFVSDLAHPHYLPSKNIIVLRGISSAFGIYTLLHEYGHARQAKDKRYGSINMHYGEFQILQRMLSEGEIFPSPEGLRKVIAKIARATDMDELVEQTRPLVAKFDHLFHTSLRTTYQSGSEKKQCFIEGEALLTELQQVLEIPRKILERDADARMLQDLRTLRDRGIDLLVPFIAEGEEAKTDPKKDNACDATVKKVIKDIYQRMNEDLSTYKASTPQIWKTYNKIPRLRNDAQT